MLVLFFLHINNSNITTFTLTTLSGKVLFLLQKHTDEFQCIKQFSSVSFLVELSKGAVSTRRPEDEAFLVPTLSSLFVVSVCPNAVALS